MQEETSKVKLRITNSSGKLIWKIERHFEGGEQIWFLPKTIFKQNDGVYFFELSTKGSNIKGKLIKHSN